MALRLASARSRIVTIENDAESGRIAQGFFEKTGVDDRVRLVLGDAIPVLKTLSGSFDFVFLDASKEEYLSYLQLLLPRLSQRPWTHVFPRLFFTQCPVVQTYLWPDHFQWPLIQT